VDSTPGGTWSVNDPTKATISSTGFVTTLDTGVVVITYLMPTGCQANFILLINPNPSPINVGPGRVCAGDSLLLTDVDTAGAWSATPIGVASIGGSTGMLHGLTGGVATISYTFSTGCYTTAQITVDPIGPITGPNQVCVNDSIVLVDTFGASLGTFSSSNTLIATVHATTGKVYGISAGVDTIYYTMPTGCSAYYIITVNPLPGFIAGPDSVCQFNTITLTNVVPLGTWTSSNPGVASIGSGSGILTGNTPGVVTITYMLPTGCYITKQVTVNLTPSPIGGITHVCLGRQITMTDPTPGGIWTSTNSGIPITSGGVVSGNILDTTIITYTLPIGGCTATTIVTVNPVPTVIINPNPVPIKCKYATQVLTASGAGAGGVYHWSPASGLSGTVGPVVVCNATVTTTYTVKGTTQWGCDTTATVTVVVDDSLDHMRIVGKDNICEGECDTLMASGRAHTYFNWHPASGLSCTICDTVSACPTKTTQYWAVAIDDIGCKDSVSFTVNVRPLPLLHVNPSPTIVCRGRPLQLKVGSNTTDSTTDVYFWSPNLFISCDTCDNPILIDTANIVYRVIGTSVFGCFDSLNVKVSVLDTNRNTISHDTDICYGGTALLVATSHSVFSNLDIPTFTWFPVWALSAPDSAMTFANPSSTATYSVAIHENACWDDTLSVTVRVQPYPAIFISANASTNIVAGTPVQLNAIVTNTPVQHYIWSPEGTLSCDSCFNPIATPTVNTTYTVTVTSIYGCTITDTISLGLYCDNSQIFIPNTFTPNGDGANDLFFVSGKGIKIITLMQVYNRWGQMVFEAHNIPPNTPGAGWDGTFKGLVLEPDVFVYVVKAQCELGTTTYSYTGDVSIVK
jgi:gliding motility-associated-like protein